ncbi:MAG: hypothetical protein Q7S34_00640 [bacterium]|nr:hypothetical protein [bacterium]
MLVKKISQMRIFVTNHFIKIAAVFVITVVLITGLIYSTGGNSSRVSEVQANASDSNVSGFAWSDNVGWISFNCKDSSGDSAMDTCPAINGNPGDYGVNIDTSTGYFSGYAWSDSIGWINFAPVAGSGGCTSGECRAQVDLLATVDTLVTGWARACGVFASGCSGALKSDSDLGGWDGWIKMSDASWTNGVYLEKTTGDPAYNHLRGFAWGGVLGWLDFDAVASGGSGVLVDIGPPVVTLDVDPSTPLPIPYGAYAKVNWTVTGGAEICSSNSVPAINWSGEKSTLGGTQNNVGPMETDTQISLDCENSRGEHGNASLILTVSAFDLTITNPVSRVFNNVNLDDPAQRTKTITVHVATTLGSSFSGPITLSATAVTSSGAPIPGIDLVFSPTSITPGQNSTLTVVFPTVTPNGAYYTVTVAGDGGNGLTDTNPNDNSVRFNVGDSGTRVPPTYKEVN